MRGEAGLTAVSHCCRHWGQVDGSRQSEDGDRLWEIQFVSTQKLVPRVSNSSSRYHVGWKAGMGRSFDRAGVQCRGRWLCGRSSLTSWSWSRNQWSFTHSLRKIWSWNRYVNLARAVYGCEILDTINDRMRGFVACFESKGLLAATDLTRLALCRRICTIIYRHFKSRAVKCLLLPETFIFIC